MKNTVAEQLREWAKQIEGGKTPLAAIIAGMREVANDLETETEEATRVVPVGDDVWLSALGPNGLGFDIILDGTGTEEFAIRVYGAHGPLLDWTSLWADGEERQVTSREVQTDGE